MVGDGDPVSKTEKEPSPRRLWHMEVVQGPADNLSLKTCKSRVCTVESSDAARGEL